MSSVTVSFQPMSAKGALLTKDNFAKKVADMTRKATFVAATESHKYMVKLIRSPKSGSRVGRRQGATKTTNLKTGKVRYRKERTVFHIASAPGEPPANDTGNLIGSITHTQNEDRSGVVSSSVKVLAPYGKWLEYGTVKMAERPFIRPTKEHITPIFKEYVIMKLRKMNKEGTVS